MNDGRLAYVKDESTGRDTYFIYVSSMSGTAGGNVRFSNRANAEAVADAINKAWASEGKTIGHASHYEDAL